jgi:hypothetical protein
MLFTATLLSDGRARLALADSALGFERVSNHVLDQFHKCREHPTFFGVHVDRTDEWNRGICGV